MVNTKLNFINLNNDEMKYFIIKSKNIMSNLNYIKEHKNDSNKADMFQKRLTDSNIDDILSVVQILSNNLENELNKRNLF